jgi:hypothetical protein
MLSISVDVPGTGKALAISAILLMSGCFNSGPTVVTGTVNGKVQLDGRPLAPGCVVVFNPNSIGADTASGLIQENGTYVAASGVHDGIPVGEYKVTIQPPAMEEKAKEELEKKNSTAILTALVNRDRKALKNIDNPQAAIVPIKYWTLGTSDLSFTVKEGKNDANFDLTAEKKKK